VIVAFNGGLLTHPDWYYNLKADPRVRVEVGTQTFSVLAEELDETSITRQIPVFMLTCQDRTPT
jgi:deazaflavin-dependent oxidoreductase (nitroreductase family)